MNFSSLEKSNYYFRYLIPMIQRDSLISNKRYEILIMIILHLLISQHLNLYEINFTKWK